MLLQNWGYMKVPEYIQKLLDEVSGENRPELFRSYIYYAVLFTLITGVALYFMRRLIIIVSRMT